MLSKILKRQREDVENVAFFSFPKNVFTANGYSKNGDSYGYVGRPENIEKRVETIQSELISAFIEEIEGRKKTIETKEIQSNKEYNQGVHIHNRALSELIEKLKESQKI
jgi:hypothetical protein